MNYSSALQWAYSLQTRGIRLELARMRRALALRGNPHRDLKFIHVAGTNGKGSVCALLEASLRRAGYRTGLYTSPHLHRFVERIQIAGIPISESSAARGLTRLRAFCENASSPALTFFEVATLLAFEEFRKARCEIVVLETGLGGRFDATNVVSPVVSVITKIGFDHMNFLGSTLDAIAFEKAGIIKRHTPVFVAPSPPKALRTLRRVAKEKHAPFNVVKAGGANIPPSTLEGGHQRLNEALADATLRSMQTKGWRVTRDDVRFAFQDVTWPGRLERISYRGFHVLFDAAHNEDGCRALARYVRDLPKPRRTKHVLVFGAMKDKDVRSMLKPLRPLFDCIVFSKPPVARGLDPNEARPAIVRKSDRVVADPVQAFQEAIKIAGKSGLCVVAGSIFVMAPVRAHALKLRTDPPIAM